MNDSQSRHRRVDGVIVDQQQWLHTGDGIHGWVGGTFLMLATIALFMAIGAFVFGQGPTGRFVYQKVVVLAAALCTIPLVMAVSFSTHRVIKSPQDKGVDREVLEYLQLVRLHGWRRNEDR